MCTTFWVFGRLEIKFRLNSGPSPRKLSFYLILFLGIFLASFDVFLGGRLVA